MDVAVAIGDDAVRFVLPDEAGSIDDIEAPDVDDRAEAREEPAELGSVRLVPVDEPEDSADLGQGLEQLERREGTLSVSDSEDREVRGAVRCHDATARMCSTQPWASMNARARLFGDGM
jgi:hypothetical protein